MCATVRLGWVGVRGYGRRFWDSINKSPLCNIVACLHPDTQVANEAATRMNCLPFTELDDLLDYKDVDALVISIPNKYHYDYSRRALESGKHVFVEKPLTNSVAEGEMLVRLSIEKSRVLMVGHNYRKSGFLKRMKKELENGRIGKIVASEFNMGHGGGLKFKPHQWRFHREEYPGGPLNMLGTHLIDAANNLFGKPKSVSGIVKNMYADTTAEDMSLIQVCYQNGVVANIVNLYNSASTEFINIYGTNGALHFKRWPVEGLWLQPKDIDCNCAPYEALTYEENNTALEIFEDFIRAIQENTLNQTNSTQALEVVRVMEAALMFHKTGKLIQLCD